MKFLVCIFISFFCVFAQAQDRKSLSLDSLINGVTNKIPSDVLNELAKQGHSTAQLELATMYLKDHYTVEDTTKVSEDLERSLHWFTKAAGQGNAKAQAILGTIYCCSDSWNFRARKEFPSPPLVRKSLNLAWSWLQESADQGNTEAKHQLAVVENELVEVNREIPYERRMQIQQVEKEFYLETRRR